MTDLTTLTSPDSSLFLLDASGRINAHGQIAGVAFDMNTGEVHAYLATPKDGAMQPTSSAAAAWKVKFVLPENVRTMLGRNMGLRYKSVRSIPLRNH